MLRTCVYILVLCATALAHARAQELVLIPDTAAVDRKVTGGSPYFFQNLPYGSDANFGPFDVILNKGYAISQTETGDRRVFGYPYGARSVGDALARPLAAIERSGGWWDFTRKELLPLSYRVEDVKWWTNYTGHLLEGGIQWRRLKEYYALHGVPWAGFLAGVTTMSTAVLNEMYEAAGQTQGTSGTVADLYVFDLAGIALFSSSGVSRFFSEKLGANVWTGQASITLPRGEVTNNANYLYFKLPWGPIRNTSIFYWTGIGGQLGLTFHRPQDLDLSFAAGWDAKRMDVDPITGEETAELAMSVGGFIDRKGSLLASFQLSQVRHRLVRINVYPRVLPVLGDFGAWFVMSRDFEFSIGLSNSRWLGLGVGVSQ